MSKQSLKEFIKRPAFDQHKGQMGRIGVVGGSKDYTGAPYFAAMSALRSGADLAQIFCDPTAGEAIKTYSPEIIVHPLLPDVGSITKWLDRLHAVIIGPGLGASDESLESASALIQRCSEMSIPLVIDAEASQVVNSISSTNVVVTPNPPELSRMSRRLLGRESSHSDAKAASHEHVLAVSEAIGGATILRKGAEDLIASKSGTSGESVLRQGEGGSPRRCGGQGDVACGVAGTLLAWGTPPELAAYGASLITRRAAEVAFKRRGRSMLTTDLVCELGGAIEDEFEKN